MSDVMTDRRDSPRFALTLVAIVTELATSNVMNARSRSEEHTSELQSP